jgi:hypothetical protein
LPEAAEASGSSYLRVIAALPKKLFVKIVLQLLTPSMNAIEIEPRVSLGTPKTLPLGAYCWQISLDNGSAFMTLSANLQASLPAIHAYVHGTHIDTLEVQFGH